MATEKRQPGQLVSERFRLVKELGAGAFATVWQAEDLAGGGEVALKLLHQSLHVRQEYVDRFIKEAEILSRLHHPNLVEIIAWGVVDKETLYLALELVEGQPLDLELMARAEAKVPFGFDVLKKLITEMCAAVSHAHEHRIVHRDLKPSNVLLSEERTRVIDFGVAKVLDESPTQATTIGRVLGTRSYLSPEQIFGKSVDHRADIFAIGTMTFELLTLHRCWIWDAKDRPAPADIAPRLKKENTLIPLLQRIHRGKRPIPSAYRLDLSEEIDEVLLRSLSIHAADRFDSAEAFAQAMVRALEQCQSHQTDKTLTHSGPVTIAKRVEIEQLGAERSATPGGGTLSLTSPSKPGIVADTVEDQPMAFAATAEEVMAMRSRRSRSRFKRRLVSLFTAGAMVMVGVVLGVNLDTFLEEKKLVTVDPPEVEPEVDVVALPIVDPQQTPKTKKKSIGTKIAKPTKRPVRSQPVDAGAAPAEKKLTGFQARVMEQLSVMYRQAEATPDRIAMRDALAKEIEKNAAQLWSRKAKLAIDRCLLQVRMAPTDEKAVSTMGICLKKLRAALLEES